MSLAYLASPYTHPDAAVREHRYLEACRVAGKLMKAGKAIFAPIPHSCAIEQHFSDGKMEGMRFWLTQDFAILKHCTELLVLRLDGWEESKGIAAEIAFASAMGIPINFVDPTP